MSSHCSLHFLAGAECVAILYQHSGGEPDEVLSDLARFFADEIAASRAKPKKGALPADLRFDDPSFLAVRYILWRHATNPFGVTLLGLGVCTEPPTHVLHRYFLHCDEARPPRIEWEEVDYGTGRTVGERKSGSKKGAARAPARSKPAATRASTAQAAKRRTSKPGARARARVAKV